MDYAVQYVEEKNHSKMMLPPTNQTRLRKIMMCTFQLVGLREISKTLEFRKIEETSCMCWRYELLEVPKPSKKSVETRKEFIEWLHQQQIVTTVDFEQSIQCKYEMSVTKRRVKKTGNNTTEHYGEADDRRGRKHCRTIDEEK